MKIRRSSALAAGLVIATLGFTAQVLSQSKSGEASKPKAEPPKEHAEAGSDDVEKPGPAHAMLAKYVGDWELSTTMAGPGVPKDAPPSKGTCTITSMLGGRFFMEQEKGVFGPDTFESIHYVGYNNKTKEYEANWTWTLDTGMLRMKGTSSDGGKTISWKGTFTNEQGKDENLLATSKYTDADHFSLELKGEDPANSMIMNTTYTRKK